MDVEKIKSIQKVLGVEPDGLWGPKSQLAFDSLFVSEFHIARASSFADLADVAAFKKAKAKGMSDQEAFKYGDNGIGFTGMDCADTVTPMCALPPEIWKARWQTAGNASGRKVEVTHKDKTVTGIMGDTMPSLKNIHNGAGIDLNPGFARLFDLKPPFMVPVTWRWAE